MGLTHSVVALLIKEHKIKPFAGPVLTLGRQAVWVTSIEIGKMLASTGILPQDIANHSDVSTKIPSQPGKYIADSALFQLIGIKPLEAMDVSDYEHGDIIADLNLPVSTDLHNRYNLIVDGGTLEHIFDIRQAMTNINLMVKPGGRVIHISPAANFIGHGFYSFSPELFYEYYSTNQFINLKAYLIAQGSNYLRGKVDLWAYPYGSYAGLNKTFKSKNMICTIFFAEKVVSSTYHAVPIQGQNQVLLSNSSNVASKPEPVLTKAVRERNFVDTVVAVGRRFPPGGKSVVRPLAHVIFFTVRHIHAGSIRIQRFIAVKRLNLKEKYSRTGGLRYLGKI
jgi:hypothetical protein